MGREQMMAFFRDRPKGLGLLARFLGDAPLHEHGGECWAETMLVQLSKDSDREVKENAAASLGRFAREHKRTLASARLLEMAVDQDSSRVTTPEGLGSDF